MVEDDPATRKALRSLIGRRGWDVTAVANLANARTVLGPEIDYVILDLMLPDGDGSTLLQAVREAGLPARVIITSGSVDPDKLESVRRLEPHALLSKPVDLDELFRALGLSR